MVVDGFSSFHVLVTTFCGHAHTELGAPVGQHAL